MHNPTRRVKRFKRPLSSTRSLDQLLETSDARFDIPAEGGPTSTSSNYARHRPAAQPDALRGTMLVALIVATVVLYVLLWELQRSSFRSVSKLCLNQSVMAASLSCGDSPPEATSTPYPPTIFQDAPVFPSGGESDLFGDQIAVPSSKPGRTTPNVWPPSITRVPEEQDTDDLEEKVDDSTRENEKKNLSSFNSVYCIGTCRFLLPARVGEQESKARVHFIQLLKARSTTQSNDCAAQPSLRAEDDSRDFRLAMDLDGFTKWVDERPVPPSSFVVSMESIPHSRRDVPGTQAESEDVPFIVENAKVDSKILSCLESKLARLHPSLPETGLFVSFDQGSLKTESDVSMHLVQLLSNSLDMDVDSDLDLMAEPSYEYTPQYTNSSYLSLADVDVLVLDYDLRYPLFAASALPNFNLHYAPVLYDLADRLSDNLGPFLGVHWRMENVPMQNLAWTMSAGKNVRHVWLATDHPRPISTFMDGVRFPVDDDWVSNDTGGWRDESPLQNYGPLRKSSTFNALSSEHDAAIGILVEAFRPGGDLEAWKLTDLAEQLRRYPYVEGKFDVNEALLGDSGVFGILDKLVVVQARVFVSGSTDCSKTRFVSHLSLTICLEFMRALSSFSKQVIEARQESLEAERGKGGIHNVVEYFGTQ
ncbi:hypothetical protein J3R82DRAFT_11955 [Butyriboletus roseoflavus]|nr:hypothetical protein J3R82DRAFT_11955 [Butyriboletus roseoflavus]